MNQWITANSQKFWRIWLMFLVLWVVLAGASLFLVDQSWAQFFGRKEMEQVWLFHRKITDIGEAGPYLVLAVLGLLWTKIRKKSAYLLACMLSSGLILHIFKFLVGRERPHKTLDHNPFIFEPFNIHDHFQSFPSGHSQTLFSIAAFAAYQFPKTTPWIFILAFYLALTRMITLAHFMSDVWTGAFIGVLVSAITLRYLVRKYGA
jgi:membrane-associated phospholipid phosphatase